MSHDCNIQSLKSSVVKPQRHNNVTQSSMTDMTQFLDYKEHVRNDDASFTAKCATNG